MVLLNIETLSDSEIRYIAQQEDIEDWDSLSREDLIEILQDIYADVDADTDVTRSRDHKYFNTLASAQSDVSSLPGVSPVTDKYNETYINVIGRDSNWVYAFWEVAENKKKEMAEEKASLVVCVKSDSEYFEIAVSLEDNNWNVELPWDGKKYVFKLISRTSAGDEVLCSSAPYQIPVCYYKNHTSELKKASVFKLLVPSMTSVDGQISHCPAVKEIVENAQ